jgi:hypothetical protein
MLTSMDRSPICTATPSPTPTAREQDPREALVVDRNPATGDWACYWQHRQEHYGFRHGPEWDDIGLALAAMVFAYFLIVGFVLSTRALNRPER